MAAVYSGLHRKLKSPQTPWEDRLKLARFAWISSQCLLANKEQVLLDWCSHALTLWHHKKVELSPEVLEGLWCYLDEVLHSKKLRCFLKEGKTVTLKLSMAQLLIDSLQDCAHGSPQVSLPTLLSVCQGILSSSVLSSIFTTKYEFMVRLLAKFCFLACYEIQKQSPTKHQAADMFPDHHHSDFQISSSLEERRESDATSSLAKPKIKPSAGLFELLVQVLSCYLSVQRQQSNPNRVFTLVTNQLIQPLVLLRYLLSSQEMLLRQKLLRDIQAKMDSILQSALFPSEHLASYKAELVPTVDDSGKHGPGGMKGPLKPVSALLSKVTAEDYCDKSLCYSVKAQAACLLYSFFLQNYRKTKADTDEEQRMLCFYFLTRLVSTLDIKFHEDSVDLTNRVPESSGPSPESWMVGLQSVATLLNQTVTADIYNVAADRIRHKEVQFNFYKSLSRELLCEAKLSMSSWYHCLNELLSLNHLILEADLEHLLSSVWVNNDETEAKVQEARQLTVCSLLRIYTKLRQLPRLLSALLSVICRQTSDNQPPSLLSEKISTSLKTCLLDTPSSQVLDICSAMLERIRMSLLPELTDGGDGGQRRKSASLKLSCLCRMLHTVLFNLKTLDNSSPVPLVRKSKGVMEEVHQTVKDVLHLLSAAGASFRVSSGKKFQRKGKQNNSEQHSEFQSQTVWQQKSLEAALLLRYTWVEVDTLFHIHCSKYTLADPLLTVGETDASQSLAHIEGLVSGNFIPPHLHPSSSPLMCLLLKLLILQQIKKICMESSSVCESSTEVLLQTAVRFIVGKSELELEVDQEQAWDGQIGSVDCSTYHVAHWYVIISNFTLISPHLSGEDKSLIAHVLLQSLLDGEMQGSRARPTSSLTFSMVTSQLALSPVFPELASLFSASLCSLTGRMISVLKAASASNTCPRFLTIWEKENGSVPSGRSDLQTGMSVNMKEALVKDILASSEAADVLLLSDAQTKILLNLLQVLGYFHPDGMNSEDLSAVFLLLFFVLTSTSTQAGRSESGGEVVFYMKLLRSLTSLLEGHNFHAVLKLIHGGPLLQAALSSLLLRRGSTVRDVHSSDWLDLVKAMQDFVKALVQLIIARNSVRMNLDQIASYLTSDEVGRKHMLSRSETSPAFAHLLLASLSSFSKVIASNLGRSNPLDQTLTHVLFRTNQALGRTMGSVLKAPGPGEIKAACSLNQAFTVEVITVMMRSELALLSVKSCLHLSHMSLYQLIFQQILREMSSTHRPMDFTQSSVRFLSVFYEAVEKTGAETEKLFDQILENLHKLLRASWLSSAELCELEPAVQELLRHLLEKSTTSQFATLLLMIRDGLDGSKLRAGNWKDVLWAVLTVKLLTGCHLPDGCSKALWLTAPDFISTFVFLVRCSSQEASLTIPFTVPTMTSMTLLLRRGEGLITNSHHVILVLGALQSLPLHNLSPPVYQTVFLAVHETMFTIIQCHPQVISKAAPSFLNVFYRLVASIMQEGRQRSGSESDSDADVYLQCSRLIQRMYSHIAAVASSFTHLWPFIVAQYVTELQKVTLRADVKLLLTEGIYCILDQCKEQDVRFLKARLHAGVSEVFNELYSSFTHYHKPQRQGEDKYTV